MEYQRIYFLTSDRPSYCPIFSYAMNYGEFHWYRNEFGRIIVTIF